MGSAWQRSESVFSLRLCVPRNAALLFVLCSSVRRRNLKTKKKKRKFLFKFFIQKRKNIGLAQTSDRGYILWSLCSHRNAGPFPPQHTGTRLYWNGSHAATAVIFAMPFSKWSHIIKASLMKTNCSPYIYLRIHIA